MGIHSSLRLAGCPVVSVGIPSCAVALLGCLALGALDQQLALAVDRGEEGVRRRREGRLGAGSEDSVVYVWQSEGVCRSADSCRRALRESARGGAEECGGTAGTTAGDVCAARAEVGRRREERSAMPGGAGGWAVGAGVSAVRSTGGSAGWVSADARSGKN